MTKDALAFISGLAQGQSVGGYETVAVYRNSAGGASGARFRNRAAEFCVDILYFPSVPQASLYFNTLPSSDNGAPHALEHIVLSKGKKGKYLSLLTDMCMGESTAATYPELTAYQFNTASGMEGFYKVLAATFDTLINPDFEDEEVVREVYNLDAQRDPVSGELSLEEKGSVYNEMVSAMEKPSSVNWEQFSDMAFGPAHPLARNSGGEPDSMRALSPGELRAFHAANYRIGPNMGFVCALPPSVMPDEFLSRLDSIVAPYIPLGKGVCSVMPQFSPYAGPGIVTGRYPSSDASTYEDIFMAWRPRLSLSIADSMRLGLFMELLGGGEMSCLHKDVVDRSVHKIDLGISSVGAALYDPPMNLAFVSFSGLASGKACADNIERLRDIVQERVRWFAGLGRGTPESDDITRKAESIITSRRKGMLKFVDNPPHFGDRSGGVSWHKHLEMLNERSGFDKYLTLDADFDALLAEVRAGGLWSAVIEQFGLMEKPFTSLVLPDASLLKRQIAEKAARLADGEKKLCEAYGLKPDAALARRIEESRALDEKINKRDAGIEKPGFVENPPLVLDDTIKTSVRNLPSARNVTVNRVGDSPFTDIALYFDLSWISKDELVFLPLLAPAITGAGVVTEQGEKLDYAAMIERFRAEIYSLGSSISANPNTGRMELCVRASACGREEIGRAVVWLENCLFRPLLSVDSSERLCDLIAESVMDIRTMMTQREEYWVRDAAAAVVFRDRPAWLSVKSPFAELFNLERLRVMLGWKGKNREIARALESIAADKGAKLKEHIAGLPEELSGQFMWYQEHSPDSVRAADTGFLAGLMSKDLSMGPEAVISGLKSLLEKAMLRGHLRVVLTGSRANTSIALKRIGTLVSRMTEGSLPICDDRRDTLTPRVKARYPRLDRVIHAAIPNEAAKTGSFVLSVPAVSYRDTKKSVLTDFLAVKAMGGGGAHSLFMKTWSSGLAYSNGINVNPASGRMSYYAERCPSLVETIRFVSGEVRAADISDPFMAEYALANSFTDYRGAEDYSSRGYAMAGDLADGITPAVVKKFKKALLRAARSRGSSLKMQARVVPACAGVLPGLDARISSNPAAAAVVIAPEQLLSRYEAFLAENGEAEFLPRLYPRDFWIY